MKLLMKLTFILGLLALTAWASETAAPTAYPPHVVANTELRVLPRTRPDRLYQLHIRLPDGFRAHPEKKYPVVFVADGYWTFTLVADICGALTYGRNVPEMLVVGLGYAGENLDYVKMREEDLTPFAQQGVWQGGGRADQFLSMIETEVIPLLEREYRADPAHRYLMGCSSGGCFVVYSLLTKPDLFQGYVADSPGVDGMQHFERELVAAGRKINARVFISEAENEWAYYRKQIGVFYRRLERDGLVQGGLKFHRATGVRHAASQAENYTQGLLFVTDPIAPEHGIMTDLLSDPENRPGFAANFWFPGADPAVALTATQEDIWSALSAQATKLLGEKKLEVVFTTPVEGKRRYATWTFFAKDRAAAETLVRDVPGVREGVIASELIPAEE